MTTIDSIHGNGRAVRPGVRYRVKAVFGRHQSLYHASNLCAGLWLAGARGVIRVELPSVRSSRRYAQLSKIGHAWLDVVRADTGESRLLCIDGLDRSDLFSEEALRRCDVYLKRSYYAPDLAALPAELREKVQPFGMNYACRCAGHDGRFLRLLMRQGGLCCREIRTGGLADLREVLVSLRSYLSSPGVDEFECDPAIPLEPTILFQTRIWREDDTTDSAQEINEGRVRVIRALKKAFGSRFVGGLVPCPLAKHRYPDALTTQQSRRSAYVAMSKRSLIGVYTRGLHHSIAYKFPEYLAAAKCIVSEPLRNTLPAALQAGVHYLPFASPQECVEACGRLLENPALASAMRRANHRYYLDEVRPDAHLLACLDRAFAPSVVNPMDAIYGRAVDRQ